jgi:hypothetical protein
MITADELSTLLSRYKEIEDSLASSEADEGITKALAIAKEKLKVLPIQACFEVLLEHLDNCK